MTDHVVVVVHGVGDPQPGDALSGLVHGYCAAANASLAHPMSIERRRDGSHPNADREGPIPLFPMAKAAVASGVGDASATARVYEVYWGDLSRVKGSLLGLLEGVVDLVFGVRHVVFAAQRELIHAAGSAQPAQPPVSARLARAAVATINGSSTAALWLVRGPLLAFNILGALVTLLFLAAASMSRQNPLPIDPAHAAAGLASLIGLGLGIVAYLTSRRLHWSTSTSESTIVLATAGMLAALTVPGSRWSIKLVVDGFTSALSAFALPLAIVMLVMLIVSLGTAFGFLLDRDARARRAAHRALVVVNACTILSCALFVFLVMVAWSFLISQTADTKKAANALPSLTEPLRQRIAEGLHLFGLIWVFFILIGLVYAGLMWRSHVLKNRDPLPERFPRYIVHPLVVTLLLLAGAVSALVFIPLILQLECQQFWGRNAPLCADLKTGWPLSSVIGSIESLNRLGLVLSGALVSVLIAAHAHLGTGLDMALDVISHFKRAERTGTEVLKDTGRRVGQYQYAVLSEPDHTEWNAMVGRFRDVVEMALAGTTQANLTVIAHSQGTMIALEALGVVTISRTDQESVQRRVAMKTAAAPGHVQLITMGCPLNDLYMHYFPEKYHINCKRETLVDAWTNIHRADDFVGTSIPQAETDFPRDVRVGARGHTDYWTDSEVLRALSWPVAALKTQAPQPASPKAPGPAPTEAGPADAATRTGSSGGSP